ncbi:hypothetical protein D9M68_418880 [compost metagenome]
MYRAGRDFHGGITKLALEMDLAYDDLQKKLKLDYERRWPNPDELEDLIRLTRDPRLLDALMRPADAVWYRPEPVAADRNAMKALGQLLREVGEVVSSFHDGASDGRWEAHEEALLDHHINRAIRQMLGIRAGVRAAREGRQDG